MSKSLLSFCIIICLCCMSVYGQLVETSSQLNTAISNASAGTTIILANQTWTDVQININKTGTASNPITIKAETPGSVFFEGRSNISLGGSYIIFEGVVFQNASGLITDGDKIEPIIEFRDTSNNDCVNCLVRNIKIDSYNGTASQETLKFKWIIIYGEYNEVSYSSFIGKNGVGSIINDNHNNSTPDYSKIHHNYFADRVPVGNDINGLNDQDAIRIGVSTTSLSDSFTEVYDNFFYNWSGEVEIISNKCGSNKYYNNTFRDYQGTLTLRHGNNTEVYGNYFFANNNSFSGGIRVIGEDHKIYNNYIEGVNHRKPNGNSSGATGGINVSNGKLNSELNEYYQVKNVQIVNNTLVNCDLAIRVGTKVKSDLTLAPENLVIANNIMLNSSDSALEETTAPTLISIYEGNITQNGDWDLIDGVNSNQTVTSGLLSSGSNFYRLATGSAAINSGLGSYSFLTVDILGGLRPSDFDAGAEEFNSVGTNLPYSQADVGVKIGFGAYQTLSLVEFNLDEELKIFPNPVEGNYLTLSKKNENIGSIKVLDLLGRTVQQNYIASPTGKIDVTNLSKGMYILKVNNGFKRILIQ
ncbi:chondroitinase-B domain-containing protein [Aureibaculum conchae]|uniref:chondroitinase-B domain-containing protein n=1 Tax=Aureibaculum sp. 2308TA14-22 TaxID=3108392 RepID=UPI0033949EBD